MALSNVQKFYITTAIDYPNGEPHIGHAYEKIVTDCYARWYRLLGANVFFVTGTDENGQKLCKSAEKSGLSTAAFVDENVVKFKKLCTDLNITHNDFIRTSEGRHAKVVQGIWTTLKENGDIYLGRYSGNYCIACEAFYPDAQAKDGKCPVHELPLNYTEEDGYFFKLSKYQDWIIGHISENPEFLFPSNIRTEILSRLKGEAILDLSISRPNQGWGIPVPSDEAHVIYTWFDALISYLAATLLDESGKERSGETWWPASVHVIGKDITWFHAVIWPAMLKSAGYALPEQIFVHGMVLGSDGKRMSKSLGNGVDPQECLSKHHVDSLRYHLLKAIPSGQDGAFALSDLIRTHNTELANEYGNLLNRVVKLTLTNLGEKIEPRDDLDFELEIFEEVRKSMEDREHHKSLASIWTGVRRLNAYINTQEPWRKKEDKAALHKIMYTALLNLNLISTLLLPFIPESAERAVKMLGADGGASVAIGLKRVAFNLKDEKPLFPRIDV
jgi:methionyl-tRNA synthetase